MVGVIQIRRYPETVYASRRGQQEGIVATNVPELLDGEEAFQPT